MADLISAETIAVKILLIRGKRVILDKDLAKLYEVDTRQLTRQVRRNIDRFSGRLYVSVNKRRSHKLDVSNWHIKLGRYP